MAELCKAFSDGSQRIESLNIQGFFCNGKSAKQDVTDTALPGFIEAMTHATKGVDKNVCKEIWFNPETKG